MTRITRKQLPSIAKENGWGVVEKQGKYTFSKKGVIIVMYENGNLVRGDVDLSLCVLLKLKEVVEMLVRK